MAEICLDTYEERREARNLAREKALSTARRLYAATQIQMDDALIYPELGKNYIVLREFNNYGVSLDKPYYDTKRCRDVRKQALKSAIAFLVDSNLVSPHSADMKYVAECLGTTPKNLKQTIEEVDFRFKPRTIARFYKRLKTKTPKL